MEIKRIGIRNFKGIPNLVITPEKLNFVTGTSGAGKSSVMAAIRYGITGKVSGTQMTAGAATSSVDMDIDKIGVVSRSATVGRGANTVRLNHKTTTAKSVHQMFEDVLGVSAADVNLLTSSEVIEHALGKDLAEYLLTAGFLTTELTLKQLLDVCPTLPSEVADELKHYFSPIAARITLDDIDKAHDYFKSQRPVVKRILADEEAQSRYPGDAPTKTAKAVQEELEKIQAEIAIENKAAIDYPKAQAQAKRLKDQIAELKTKIAALPSKRVTTRELTLAEENRKNAQKLLETTNMSIDMAKRDIKQLQSTIDSLNSNVCPISKQLVCTTDKSKVREELETTLSTKEDLIGVWEDEREAQQAGLDAAVATLTELQQQEHGYSMRITLMGQLEELEKITVIIPSEPNPAKLTSLNAKRDAYHRELTYIRAYESAQAHAEVRDSYQKQLRIIEQLIDALAPSGGVRKTLLERSLAPLETWCNSQMLSVLPKYTMYFDSSNNFELYVTTSTGERLLYEDLSTGEQLRIIYIIMGMLNELNGVRVLLLDNVNALDIAAFKDFLHLVELNIAGYDHVFISGVNHEGFKDAVKSCTVPHQIIEL